MLKVKDLKTLMKLKTNNQKDEVALVEETRTLYKWDGENWNLHKPEGGLLTNLFELNQGAMTAMPAMKAEAIKEAKQLVADFVKEKDSNYFMLLSNEQKYYTVFITGFDTGTNFNYEKIEDAVFDCLQDRGILKDVSETLGAIEFWITEEKNSYVYYLFDYRGGVIKCQ